MSLPCSTKAVRPVCNVSFIAPDKIGATAPIFREAMPNMTKAIFWDAFLGQFYQDRPVPRLILISHDLKEDALMREALSLKAERKVEILRPKRGDKLTWCNTRSIMRNPRLEDAWPNIRPNQN